MEALLPSSVYYADADWLFTDLPQRIPPGASVVDVRAAIFQDRKGPDELQAALGARYLYVKMWSRPGCQGGIYEPPSTIRIPGFPVGLEQVRQSGLPTATGLLIACGCLRLYDSNHGSHIARLAGTDLRLSYRGHYGA